eukprot:scaffold7381_cov310-Pinguiococcus_pyrenoidosus.AAC.43
MSRSFRRHAWSFSPKCTRKMLLSSILCRRSSASESTKFATQRPASWETPLQLRSGTLSASIHRRRLTVIHDIYEDMISTFFPRPERPGGIAGYRLQLIYDGSDRFRQQSCHRLLAEIKDGLGAIKLEVPEQVPWAPLTRKLLLEEEGLKGKWHYKRICRFRIVNPSWVLPQQIRQKVLS